MGHAMDVEGTSVSFFRRLLPEKPAPLRNVPAVRRQKNYSAESGYAYEYFYEGMRDVAGGREHVFTVSGDRKTWFEMKVVVLAGGVTRWEASHGRNLADNERYALAKMALFEAFDQRESPQTMREPVTVGEAEAERLLERLGLD